MESSLGEVEAAQGRLFNAVVRGRSDRHCLRLWSEFIRIRDGRRCVACLSTGTLFAHHIVRKSFFPQARLQRGNGITLCDDCHREPHEAFNGLPDINQPMDAQGGDDNNLIARYFGLLLADSTVRDLSRHDFYFLHDRVLQSFKELQGFKPDVVFPGTPLEQASLIWNQTSPGVRGAIMKVNGFDHLPGDYIRIPGVTISCGSRVGNSDRV